MIDPIYNPINSIADIDNPAPQHPRNAKHTIKEAALMMLADVVVMRRGELVSELEAHMTATERGKHFFEVREAINELVTDGLIKSLLVTSGLREQHLLIIVNKL